jgi:Di- and tricarboxylate transporters
MKNNVNIKINTVYYLNCFISIALMMFFKYIPAPEPLTAYGMNIIGILVGAIYAYCTVGMIWPSCAALVLLGLSGYSSVADTLKGGFGHPIVLFVIALFIFGAVLEDSGLTKYIADWLVTRRIARGRPWVLSFLILLAAYVGGMLVNAVPPTLVCWIIVYSICEDVGYKPGDKWPAMMVFGAVFASTLGSFVTPFQIGVVGNYGYLLQASGGTVSYDYLSYLIFAFLFSIFVFAGFFAFCKYVFKPDITLLKDNNITFNSVQKLNNKQITIAILVSVLMLGLIAPCFLPEKCVLRTLLDSLGSAGWSLVIIAIMLLFKVEGQPLIDFQQMVSRGVIWEIVFMMAAAFSLAGAVVSKGTGVTEFVFKTLQPSIVGLNIYVYMTAFLILVMLLANLLNNMAVCAVFIPIMYTLSIGLDVNTVTMVALINFVGNMCFLLPASSPIAPMLYNNKEWISSNYIVRFSIATICILLVLTPIIGIPLGNLLL